MTACSSTSVVVEGQIFHDKGDLQNKLRIHALKNNFEYQVKKSGKKIWYIKCIDDKCRWKLRAVKLRGSDMFEVRKFHNKHTCSLDVRHKDHRQASASLIGHLIRHEYSGKDPTFPPNKIIEKMRKDLGIHMSYEKAWRSRERALGFIRGTPEQSFQILPSWCYILGQKNPGTVTEVVTDNENRFKYFFMALGVSIRGFLTTCRPVIAVDGTFLKGRYGGSMLIANAQDANRQIYPIAYAVVDGENNNSWMWFMMKLRECIGAPQHLAFVSDRHASITNALQVVFPEAHHGACIHHIGMNIKAKFHTDHCHEEYFLACKMYRLSQFDRMFHKIKLKDPEIAKYLENAGFDKWSRAHFPGHRYNIMTTNIAESLNNVTKKARGYPITSLAEFVRFTLQHWFYERRTEAANAPGPMSVKIETKLSNRVDRSKTMRVNPLSHYEFHVEDGELDGEVNLQFMTCTCKKFDLTKISCEHALAAARVRGISIYQLCSKFYSVEAWINSYAETIYPLPHQTEWSVPEEIKLRVVLPPVVIKKPGRQKTKRRPSKGEKKVQRRCSRCGGTGHNRQTCTSVQPLPSTTTTR